MLFDTSVFVDHLRQTNPIASTYVSGVVAGNPGYCSTITEAELWVGIRNAREEATIDALLSFFTVIPVNSGIARQAGNLLHNMNEQQRRAHFADALLAATALDVGESVLTADGRSQLVFGGQVDYMVYQ
ncbi:MAG: PIN domain-containing protein [Dehalococcoidia bacterium]